MLRERSCENSHEVEETDVEETDVNVPLDYELVPFSKIEPGDYFRGDHTAPLHKCLSIEVKAGGVAVESEIIETGDGRHAYNKPVGYINSMTHGMGVKTMRRLKDLTSEDIDAAKARLADLIAL